MGRKDREINYELNFALAAFLFTLFLAKKPQNLSAAFAVFP
jgi:hypothetical protein